MKVLRVFFQEFEDMNSCIEKCGLNITNEEDLETIFNEKYELGHMWGL